MSEFVTIDRATLEQMVDALENSIDDVRTYLADAEQLAGYPRYDRRIAAYKAQVGAHEAAITAGRAALANAEPTQSKPYAWRNPMNGVVISNDKKERLLCVGRGYPNFSEPLYVAGAKP